MRSQSSESFSAKVECATSGTMFAIFAIDSIESRAQQGLGKKAGGTAASACARASGDDVILLFEVIVV